VKLKVSHALLVVALVLGGCATTPDQVASAPEATPQAAPSCVRETGTRLRGGGCVPGRVYTGEDIRNTGLLDLGGALQFLGAP
jgi:uncharacterized protein YceK